MSQGDYIQLKKIKNRLSIVNSKQGTPNHELDPVLSSQDYTLFAGFHIASTVPNTKQTLSTDCSNNIFDIPQCYSNCIATDWTLCNETNSRPNRVLNPIHMFQPSRPLVQKGKDYYQCRTGYPFWTTLQGNPLKWPGDNRYKQPDAQVPWTPLPSAFIPNTCP
jgi:hypothetical protein